MLEHECEEKIQRISKRIQEIEIECESLDDAAKALFKELEVNYEQIQKFTAEKANFTDANWEQLQKQRIIMQEKIKQQLSLVKDPRKVKKAYSERRIEPHWMFVR